MMLTRSNVLTILLLAAAGFMLSAGARAADDAEVQLPTLTELPKPDPNAGPLGTQLTRDGEGNVTGAQKPIGGDWYGHVGGKATDPTPSQPEGDRSFTIGVGKGF